MQHCLKLCMAVRQISKVKFSQPCRCYYGWCDDAKRIQVALEKVVDAGECVTPDLNPDSTAGTIEMGEAVIAAL